MASTTRQALLQALVGGQLDETQRLSLIHISAPAAKPEAKAEAKPETKAE